jgi:hypothetical protein
MSELPDRPDLDQLRRQARELLRAATAGEPEAAERIRAVSERVTLAGAQLAIARDYGYRSWPALKADVERIRSSASSAPTAERSGERWSFGGAGPIRTSAGVLVPEALLVTADGAQLHGSLMPADSGSPQVTRPVLLPGRPFARWGRRRRARASARVMAEAVGDWARSITVVDSRERAYALRAHGMSGRRGPAGEPQGPMSVQLGLDPRPGRDVGWLEIRDEEGTATRLEPSPRSLARVSQVIPVPMSRAERTLLDRMRWLVQLRLTTTREVTDDMITRNCSAALAKTAEIQRTGELDPGSQLPDQLEKVCAVLTGQRPATSLPPPWSRMLAASGAADGPSRHCDLAITLPAIAGITVHVDSLFSGPECWRLYLRAVPGWWEYSADRQRKWSPVTVLAEDDLGNSYLSTFGRSSGAPDHEDLSLEFLPRLDPLAGALTLTFQGGGEQLAVALPLTTTGR